MSQISYNELLDAGVHFGHLTRKWNPAMAPYIFMEKNGIHIIDLNKTVRMAEDAGKAARQLARSGRKILFVATKKQAKDIVRAEAERVNMPYVTERWLGGMLTNFATVRKSVKKMSNIEKMEADGTFQNISKKERLMLNREKDKLNKILSGVADLTRLPSALYIVDIKKEHIAINEAKKLNIPTIAMVDTNSDPNQVDFAIPANDDAAKSIHYVTRYIANSISEGLSERKLDKEAETAAKKDEKEPVADSAAE